MSDESRSRSASPISTEQMENGAPTAQPTSQAQVPGRRRRAQQSQQQVQQQPLPAGVDNALSGPAGQLLTNTLSQVTGGQQSGGSGKDTLKLRLDLNLDVDVQIKARIHGDVTLSLFG